MEAKEPAWGSPRDSPVRVRSSAAARTAAARRRAGLRRRHLVLIVATLSILLPLLWILRTSLVSRRVAYLIPPDWLAMPNLDSWDYIFGDQDFLRFFGNSLVIALGSTVISLLIGVPAAYSIARWKHRRSAGSGSASSPPRSCRPSRW